MLGSSIILVFNWYIGKTRNTLYQKNRIGVLTPYYCAQPAQDHIFGNCLTQSIGQKEVSLLFSQWGLLFHKVLQWFLVHVVNVLGQVDLLP